LPELPSQSRIDAVRQTLQAKDRPIVLFPGDYEVSQAARTFAASIQRYEGTKPLFVFACRTKTPHALEEESRLRRELSLYQNDVRFIGEVKDIFALLAASSVISLPAEDLYAKMDTPLVLLEAMSFGVPIIVTNTPPLSEMLEVPCGLAVSPANADELASATRKLVESPALRTSLGETGKQRVHSFYSAKAMATRYEALYGEVLQNK
jgi:phosphatidylinositol alpha-1,6-mannosyltransferase